MKYLKIDKPCHENWNEMTPNEQGRFCAHCAKTVLDFTVLDTFQINEILQNSDGKNLCGRFTNVQLQTPIFDSKVEDTSSPKVVFSSQKSTFPFRKIAAGIAIAASLQQSCTQHTKGKMKIVDKIEFQQNSSPKEQNKANVDVHFEVISGTIVDQKTKLPIENANVYWITKIKYFHAQSDSLGNVTLSIPKDLVHEQNVIQIVYDKVKKDAFVIKELSDTEIKMLSEKERVAYYLNQVQNQFYGFESENLIIQKGEKIAIKANRNELILGEFGFDSSHSTMFLDGIEINQKKYFTLQSQISKGTYKEFYFYEKMAQILSGKPETKSIVLLFKNVD